MRNFSFAMWLLAWWFIPQFLYAYLIANGRIEATGTWMDNLTDSAIIIWLVVWLGVAALLYERRRKHGKSSAVRKNWSFDRLLHPGLKINLLGQHVVTPAPVRAEGPEQYDPDDQRDREHATTGCDRVAERIEEESRCYRSDYPGT